LTRGAGAAAAFACAVVLAVASIAHSARREPFDFTTRYAAGVVVSHGGSPYDENTLYTAEQKLAGQRFRYPFRDPPPVAWAFRGVAAVPYREAKFLWLAALLIASTSCIGITARLVGVRTRWPVLLVCAFAGSFAFGPLRDAMTRFQLDPVLGALSLAAFALARSRGSGFVQAIATLKPQGILLGTAGGAVKGGMRFVLELLAGWGVLVALTASTHGPSWRRWIDVLSAANRTHHGLGVAITEVLAAVGVVVVAATIWFRLRLVIEPGLAAFSVGAAVTSILGQQIFLNSQSRLLMVVPFGILLVRSPVGLWFRLLLGCAIGVYSTSGLFALSYYSGISHTIVPIAIGVGFAVCVALRESAVWNDCMDGSCGERHGHTSIAGTSDP
jgi:hypothetical protein